MFTILQISWSTCIASLTYLVLRTAYRLTLHPLSKYPGPFFSRISDWSIPWQCMTQDRHLIHLREHQKYGSIVRIGPNTLSLSSPKALRQIYQSGRENNPLRKSEYYDSVDAPAGAYSLHSETSRAKHAARRRVLDHGFTATALRSNEAYLVEVIETFCETLSSQNDTEWSQAKNMRDHFAWFAYDVMGALVFGRHFQCLTDSTHRFVPRMIVTSGIFVYIAANLPFQGLVRPLISSATLMHTFGGQLERDEYAYLEYANECVTQRLLLEEKSDSYDGDLIQMDTKRDIMHYIIKAQGSAVINDDARKELDADASLLIAAGADTTSTTLAALMFYLTLPSSTGILAKLLQEVRNEDLFPTLASITGNTMASLPYLRACIDEALRLAPPAPIHLPRTVVRESGIEIDGHHIPVGTTVGASAYVLHHDETAYPDSWSFNPDRWIIETTSTTEQVEQVGRAKEAFIPFSLGSRGCIGKDLAYREMCICMARLIYLFDFRKSTSSKNLRDTGVQKKTRAGLRVRDDEYQLYDCFLVDRYGPEIEFRKRAYITS